VVLEHGWELIPARIESNKAASNKWFCNYFFERDRKIARIHKQRKGNIYFERILHYQYPLTKAQLKCNKISKDEYSEIMTHLNTLLVHFDNFFTKIKVFHFVADNSDIIDRLSQRNIHKDKESFVNYLEVLREETQNYFKTVFHSYHHISTSGKSVSEVYEEAVRELS